jgi:Activator of Hsp90 ATPase homolog 1-like protein
LPSRRLQFTHFSPLAGLPDAAENYHTVTIELWHTPPITHVSLSQDNNASEQSREHSEKNWQTVLSGLKALLEK